MTSLNFRASNIPGPPTYTKLQTLYLRLIEEFAKNKQKNNTINWLNQLSKNKIQKRLDQSKLECIRFSDSRSSQGLEA